MAFFDFFKQSCDFFWRGFDLVIFDTAPTGVLEHRWEKGPRDVGFQPFTRSLYDRTQKILEAQKVHVDFFFQEARFGGFRI